MEKKKVQAKSEDVIGTLSSYLEKLNNEDKLLRTDNKRLNVPIDRFKDLHLWDAKKMVLEYIKIQHKTSNYSSDIRHWIQALVLHIIKQVEDKSAPDKPVTPESPESPKEK